jgi:hypothetical protein
MDRSKKIYKKSVFRIYGLIFLLTAVIVQANCSDPNNDAPLSNHVHPQTWNNTRFLKSIGFHGVPVNLQGTASCLICHGSNLQGSENIPGCHTCHFGPDGSRVPNGIDWTHGQDQHPALEAYASVCNECHRVQRAFDTGPDACHDCHGTGVDHPLGQAWLDKGSQQFHGDESLDACSDCHNPDQKCIICHFGATGSKASPGSGWNHGNNDAHRDYETFAATCNQCHDLNRSYGHAPPDCHDCHGEGADHLLGQAWLDKNSQLFHGDASLDNCSECHTLSQACFECHFGANGSKTPPGYGWNHGNNEDHRLHASYAAVCNQCHNLNRSYGNPPETCHDCHH